MKTKKLTETTVREVEVTRDGILYRYTLLKRESARVASYRLPLYSVKIEMESANGEISTSRSSDIFADSGKALAFFNMLAENLATPIDLPYIIEDEL